MKNYFSMMLIVLILFAIVLTSAFSAIGEQPGSQEITSGDYIYQMCRKAPDFRRGDIRHVLFHLLMKLSSCNR